MIEEIQKLKTSHTISVKKLTEEVSIALNHVIIIDSWSKLDHNSSLQDTSVGQIYGDLFMEMN